MSEEDSCLWDSRYVQGTPASAATAYPLTPFADHQGQFPTTGLTLELACGRGEAAVWFARAGMSVVGVDVSPEAISLARELAAKEGVAAQCHFEVFDLDAGLPPTAPVDLLICHNFRSPDLYAAMQQRLAPGGLLAIVTLSEVGAAPGRFRAKPGELAAAFTGLTTVYTSEGEGRAWLLARKP